jgi:type VI secretion system protein ImpE
MDAKALLDAGQLDAAIARLGDDLKAQPGDLSARAFLFDLLSFAGQFDRAEKQLDVMGHQDVGNEAQMGVRLYRSLLAAERQRARFFAQGGRPRFALEPPASVVPHLEALDRVREGRLDEARALLARAAEQRRPLRGHAAVGPFDEFRDADDLLAPILEVFSATGYFWIAWEEIQRLEIPPPRTLRDLLWAPARLALFDGQLGEVHLPCLYPGTGQADDDLTRLGRKTDWQELGAGIVRGLGAKMVLVGDETRTLFELGEVQFEPPEGLSKPAGSDPLAPAEES